MTLIQLEAPHVVQETHKKEDTSKAQSVLIKHRSETNPSLPIEVSILFNGTNLKPEPISVKEMSTDSPNLEIETISLEPSDEVKSSLPF